MSKTIQQAGGQTDGGALPTSQEITATKSIQPAVEQAGSKLANDLFGIMGEGGKTMQAANTASVKAAERVAMDSSTQLALTLTEINKKTDYNNPDSVREAEKANAVAYQELGRKTFDNEDAQRQFDGSYHDRNSVAVARTNTALEKKALDLDDEIQFKNILSATETQLNADLPLTKTGLDASAEAMSQGKFNLEDSQYGIADRSTTAFNSKLLKNPQKMLSRGGFDPKEGWTDSIASQVFENEFGAYGQLKDGKITWNDNLENKAKEEILRAWNGFETSMKEKSGGNIDPFKRLKASVTQQTSNSTGQYIPSTRLEKQFETDYQTYLDIKETQSYTGNQIDNMRIKLQEAKNNISITQRIEADLGFSGAIDTDKARSYFNNGRTIKLIDARTGKDSTHKISDTRYKTAAKTFIDFESKQAMGMQLKTSDDVVEYQTKIKKMMELEEVTNIKSTTTTKYSGVSESGKVQTFKNPNELHQLTAYNDVVINFDKKNEVLVDTNEKLKEILADENLTPTQQVANSNITIQASKNNEAGALQRSDVRKIINDKIKTEKSGSEFWTFESAIDSSVGTAMMKDIYQSKKQNIAESYVDTLISTRSMDLGSSAFGDKDQRFIRPSQASEKKVRKGVEVLLADYKKKTFKHLSDSQIVVKNEYRNGDYVVMIYSKLGKGDLIGEITSQNIDTLISKD